MKQVKPELFVNLQILSLHMPLTHDIISEQCLDIIVRFITKDFDENPLNYAEQMDIHIVPKKNKNVQLKKDRQCSTDFPYACALYHLDKNKHASNNLPCVL